MDGLNAYQNFENKHGDTVVTPPGMAAAGFDISGTSAYKQWGLSRGAFFPGIYINGDYLNASGTQYLSYGAVIPQSKVKGIFCFSFSAMQSEFEYGKPNPTASNSYYGGAGIMPFSKRLQQICGFFFSRYANGSLMFGIGNHNTATASSGEITADPKYWNVDEPNRVELVLNFNEGKVEGWINDTLLYETNWDLSIYKEDLVCGLKFYSSQQTYGRVTIGNMVTSDARIGPCNIRLSRPAEDLQTGFASKGDSNFSQLRDIPADGDETYVEANDEGSADLFRFTPKIEVSAGRKIMAVKHVVVAKRSSPDPRYLFTRIGDTLVNVPMVAAFDNYGAASHVMEINPATGVEWTAADLNNTPFGYELQDTI